MKYLVPDWYGNKRIDFAAVTDLQLLEQREAVQLMIAKNRAVYGVACQVCKQMVIDAATIFGEESDSYKDIRRVSRKIPDPPDLLKAYERLRKSVLIARENEVRRAIRRAYDRTYRLRHKGLAANEYDYHWEDDDNVYPREEQS